MNSLPLDNVPDILKRIIVRKHEEVSERRLVLPEAELHSQLSSVEATRGFAQAIQQRLSNNQPAIIAEIKKASPSRGVLRESFDPAAIATSYAEAGATCLSVLTDRDFFQGSEAALRAARAACQLPVIRKDFIVDSYQIIETRAIGADCVLLIVGALNDHQLLDLYQQAIELSLDVLVEVHDGSELERALRLEPVLLGINNRDLRTFEVSLQTTLELLAQVPAETLLVTESGILEPQHVQKMRAAGVNGFLIGEAFMRAENPGSALQELFA